MIDQNKFKCLKVETVVHLCIQLPHFPFLPHSPPQQGILFCKHLWSFLSLPFSCLTYSSFQEGHCGVGFSYYMVYSNAGFVQIGSLHP